jgi:hypothetical protein
MLLDPGPGFLEIAVSFQVWPYPPRLAAIMFDKSFRSPERRAILTAANGPDWPLESGALALRAFRDEKGWGCFHSPVNGLWEAFDTAGINGAASILGAPMAARERVAGIVPASS